MNQYTSMEQDEQARSSAEQLCPKCGHRQQGGEECRSCGIIFCRVAEREERRKAAAEQASLSVSGEYSEERGSSGLARFLMIALLVGATAGLTYFFTAKKPAEPLQAQAPAVESMQAAEPGMASIDFAHPGQASTPRVRQNTPEPVQVATGISGNRIERARNATVSVITPWGQGSGFFLLDTYIITNKHVVNADSKQLTEMQEKLRTARQLVNLEKQKLQNLRRELSRLPDGPDRQQLVIILREREAELARVTEQVVQGEEQVRKLSKPLSASDIKIRFADGREQTIYSFRLSPKRDLALLLVTMPNNEVLAPATNRNTLQQGDRVFAIGNPSGLSHTVTSGIFSGYREWKDSGEIMLQTDAPINPGNSGGPLIDEQGRVHGVNTMILRDTQGIGFAIPIKAAFDDFGLQAP